MTGDTQGQPAVVRAWESIGAQIAAEYPGWEVSYGLLGLEARRDGEVVRAVSPSGMRALLSGDALASRQRQPGGEGGHSAAGHDLDLSGEELERQFPRWHMWKGIAGLWYASRRGSSPPVVVRGEDLVGLRDGIRRWLGTH